MILERLIEPITDDDVDWVIELMGLHSLDSPRRSFLKAMDTLDVSACPGSGKTTLVVAKLAILAQHWKSRTQGVCVLSHTNAAREEIENRLGNTEVGQRLLRYPHFIDTIHGFAGRFLATSWLRSHGHPLVAIDDQATFGARRRAVLPTEYKFAARTCEFNHIDLEKLRIETVDFDAPLAGKALPFGAHTDTYKCLARMLSTAAKAGYFCFDEVFVLADALLDEEPGVADALRSRFPCVLIDEMQDTKRSQSKLLERVFPRESPALCIVRVGDPNQDIFEQDEAGTDPFPDPLRGIEISSSFRFNQAIASIANPFAYVPISGGLVGLRESDLGSVVPNSIIVFPDSDASQVLKAYGELLVKHLPEKVRSYGTWAIGAKHRLADFKPKQYPKAVEHYWAPYVPDASKATFRPRTFVEGVQLAQHLISRDSTAFSGVEMVASCMIQLAGMACPDKSIMAGGRRHQLLERMLQAAPPAAKTVYRDCLHRLLFDPRPVGEPEWSDLSPKLLAVAMAIHGRNLMDAASESHGYLRWTAPPVLVASEAEGVGALNTYRYEGSDGRVDIRLSSIHAEKGKTHAATLILETFNRTHINNKLLPLLEGKSLGAQRSAPAMKKSMMLMYVGMTRPTHMLCVAIRESSLGCGAAAVKRTEALEAAGWSIVNLAST